MRFASDFQVVDKISECDDGHRGEMLPERVDLIVVHRTIWEPGDAVGVCKRFQTHDENENGLSGLASYTGGENPYHFLIQPDAQVVQCLELGEVGAHARRWNHKAVAVALMHDTLHSPLPHEMGLSLVKILRPLCLWAGGVKKHLFGHDELPGASRDKNKVCPGVNMHAVRGQVMEQLLGWWDVTREDGGLDRLLQACGIVL